MVQNCESGKWMKLAQNGTDGIFLVTAVLNLRAHLNYHPHTYTVMKSEQSRGLVFIPCIQGISRSVVLMKCLYSFPLSFRPDAETLDYNRPRPVHNTSFPIHNLKLPSLSTCPVRTKISYYITREPTKSKTSASNVQKFVYSQFSVKNNACQTDCYFQWRYKSEIKTFLSSAHTCL